MTRSPNGSYEDYFDNMTDDELHEIEDALEPKLKASQSLPNSPFKKNLEQFEYDLSFELWERTLWEIAWVKANKV